MNRFVLRALGGLATTAGALVLGAGMAHADTGGGLLGAAVDAEIGDLAHVKADVRADHPRNASAKVKVQVSKPKAQSSHATAHVTVGSRHQSHTITKAGAQTRVTAESTPKATKPITKPTAKLRARVAANLGDAVPAKTTARSAAKVKVAVDRGSRAVLTSKPLAAVDSTVRAKVGRTTAVDACVVAALFGETASCGSSVDAPSTPTPPKSTSTPLADVDSAVAAEVARTSSVNACVQAALLGTVDGCSNRTPIDPTPTDPSPTDPAPTPTDPTPSNPTPTNPTPTDPTLTDPTPGNGSTTADRAVAADFRAARPAGDGPGGTTVRTAALSSDQLAQTGASTGLGGLLLAGLACAAGGLVLRRRFG